MTAAVNCRLRRPSRRDSSVRFPLIAASAMLAAALVPAELAAGERVATVGDGWKIVIASRDVATTAVPPAPAELLGTPSTELPLIVAAAQAPRLPAISPETQPGRATVPVPSSRTTVLRQRSYYDVYTSIPFIRAEYDANPSYRHEAAMEILFGELRPMTIHKYLPAAPAAIQPIGFSYPYMGRPRMNYNFFYPRPTVYRHY